MNNTRTCHDRRPLPCFSVVVLAGGRGERLGQGDKASVMLGQRTLLEHILSRLVPLSDDVIVVLRRDQHIDFPFARLTRDMQPYEGLLAGMAAGLTIARHSWSLVVACDMPFLDAALVAYMASQREGYDIVVPRVAEGLEPLHALYHRRCLAALGRALAEGQRRVISFYTSLRVRYLGEEEMGAWTAYRRSLFNINTREDLDQARAWLQAEEARDL